MNQLTKYILLFLFISISGYSQEVDHRWYDMNLDSEKVLPKFNDIEKIKSAKIKHYVTDSIGNIVNYYDFITKEPYRIPQVLFINEFPERFVYRLDSKTNDTISKTTYKYYEDTNTIEFIKGYATEYDISMGATENRYYDKDGNPLKNESYLNGMKISLVEWSYNSNKQIIREEITIFSEELSTISDYLYNNINQLIKRTVTLNNQIQHEAYWEYDDNGNIIKEEIVRKETNNRITTHRKYDEHNNLIRTDKYFDDTLVETADYSARLKYKEEETKKELKPFYEEKSKRIYDEHNNWVKETIDVTYPLNNSISKLKSVTEREIIYK